MFFTRTNDKEVQQESRSYEAVKEVLKEIKNGSTKTVSPETFQDRELAELLNHLIEANTYHQKHVLEVNGILDEVVEMVEVKEMVQGTEKQAEALQSMSASAEELNASIEDVAEMTQKAAVMAGDLDQTSREGSKNIGEVMKFVQKSFKDIEALQSEMIDVNEKADKINKIVDIVKGIAGQTNLLALNAAIEAARAGESGRGFAVVAEEVRKLAEHTTDSVTEIQNNITSLKSTIDESVENVNSTAGELKSSGKTIDSALKSMEDIGEAADELNGIVGQIASNTQEQAAAIETFSNGTAEIAESSEEVVNYANDIGQKIFDLSKNVDHLRMEMSGRTKGISEEDKIELYKVDHLLWRWRVYNMLLHYEKVDKNKVADYKACRLGKWYYGLDIEKLQGIPVFKKLEEPHIKLHEVAKEAAIAYDAGNLELANELMLKMDEYSREIFGYLDELKRSL